MKKVLISGIGGFIGQNLAYALRGQYEIHGVTITGGKLDFVTYHDADITDFEKIFEVVKEVQPDFVIHLAARTEVEESFYDPSSFSMVNYVGTVNLIESVRLVEELSNDWKLELFIFSSTMETYGYQEKRDWYAFDEFTEQNPNAPYAVAKVGCEYYLRYAQRAYDLPYTILRQTNTYGRDDNDFFVVEQFITQMLNNPDEVNFGNREPYRNFLYIDDLIELYKIILKNVDLAKNEVFCTGPDNVLRIEELAKMIAEIVGWKGRINWGTRKKRHGEIYYLNSTHEKAKTILGWEPKTTLEQGLHKTILSWRTKLAAS